ncbi:UDP-glucose 6-dehydrogenase, partial [Microvirga sp. KLBC 81]
MRIAMVGSGYVGLVSGACFADFGHEVCCVGDYQEFRVGPYDDLEGDIAWHAARNP